MQVNRIKNNPEDRRIIISLWDPQSEFKTVLPACDCFYQFIANHEGYLSLISYQRSADIFFGVPFNDLQDWLFLLEMSHSHSRIPELLGRTLGDCHIYKNLNKQVKEQFSRETSEIKPKIRIKCQPKYILDYEFEDLELDNYDPQKRIGGTIAI